jgi:hypothetical protein
MASWRCVSLCSRRDFRCHCCLDQYRLYVQNHSVTNDDDEHRARKIVTASVAFDFVSNAERHRRSTRTLAKRTMEFSDFWNENGDDSK